MWYFNYCSPFIIEVGGMTLTSRIIMYSAIFVLFLVYAIFMVLYRCAGSTQITLSIQQKIENQIIEGKKMLRIRFCNKENWISSKLFKEWYLCFFSMHATAVGICIMYSPYLPQTIFTCIHLVLFLLATILKHFFKEGERKVLQIIYIILMVLCGILNVMLLFSGAMGVGASGFDENAKICLLESGYQSQDL